MEKGKVTEGTGGCERIYFVSIRERERERATS